MRTELISPSMNIESVHDAKMMITISNDLLSLSLLFARFRSVFKLKEESSLSVNFETFLAMKASIIGETLVRNG
jgi:hypothetical protein